MHKLITVLFILISATTIGQIKFAVIGDFGDGTFRYGNHAANVASVVDSWNPEFVVTVGDNTYLPKKDNEADQFDSDVGQFYHQFIYPYTGQYGQGSSDFNRFFPAIGNHEYYESRFGLGIQAYLDWFDLPGNERYYHVKWNDNIEVFIINNYNGYSSKDGGNAEPDGWDASSVQASWLQYELALSTATWKLVFGHLPPYASGVSSSESLSARWPFKEWGSDAMLAGHRHNYERLIIDEMLYFVNGAGGYGLTSFGEPILGSQVRIMEYGAMLVEVNPDDITFSFINEFGMELDSYTLIYGGVIVDTTPPRILQVALIDEWTLDVVFSEPVTGADDINNYEIAGPQTITVNSVVYNNMIATLSSSEHIPGDYTITVNNVVDMADNVIDPNFNTASYTMEGPPAVEMSYFTASLSGNEVTLDWETLSENGNLGWDIEESSKNTSNFSYLGHIDGAGVSTDAIHYSFNTSLNKYGKYYYRLKQMSSDGSFSYSENVLVDYKRTRNAALSSYPNPFNPQTTVSVYLDNKQVVKVNIYNMLGQHVATLFNGTAEAGEMQFTFNGQSLSSGTYVVVMQTESSIINHKILLLK
jgi:hypothetical protein